VAANLEVARDIGNRARSIVAKDTGALAASIDASMDGEDALVGPTGSARSKNGPYGRFHELGGVHDAHNPSGYMWWPTGVWSNHAAHQVKRPHPFLKPAVEAIVESGGANRIYYEHWLIAQRAA
jgi:phage gpG-like protein